MNKGKRLNYSKVIIHTSITGFVGGVFWGSVGMILYYFNFLEINPKMYLLKPWINVEWVNHFQGDILSLLITGLLSILVSLVYLLIFRKIHSIWVGFMYGIILWCIIFIILQPLFTNIKGILQFKKETIITSLSLFILYGTFIGYSIAYDYYERKRFDK